MPSLPIDPALPDLLAALAQSGSLVLEAEPGAGKTTRFPAAALDATTGEVWVVQPRRIAARMAARHVAETRGEPVGESVGYHVRHENAAGPRTRLRFMTEGVLWRRLLEDPELRAVQVLVLDEFHERTVHGDLALAWALHLRRTRRPDLRLVVMSATLRGARVAEHLEAAHRAVTGRTFPVEVSFLDRPDDRRVEVQAAGAVQRALREHASGHILVFLPGVAEINRCRELITNVEAVPLHGTLSPAEQDRAVRAGGERRVILATNVAETSLTIDGVTVVIDTGLARVAEWDAWSGIGSTRVQKVSQASVVQRSGRAGRTQAGWAYRLFTRNDFTQRPSSDPPELQRADLTDALLLLRALGSQPHELPWLEPPPSAAVAAGEQLLQSLGALDRDKRITAAGRELVTYPAHPRQARVLMEAKARGVAAAGAWVAALMGERDLYERDATFDRRSDSDVLVAREHMLAAREARFNASALRRLGLRVGAARRVTDNYDQLCRQLRVTPERIPQELTSEQEIALRMAVLAGFPDRVAQGRVAGGERKGRREWRLALGGRLEIDPRSAVHDAEWAVVVEAEQRQRASGKVSIATLVSAIEPDWLLIVHADGVREESVLVWNDEAQRVEQIERLAYGELALDETRRPAPPSPERARFLREKVSALGWRRVLGEDAARIDGWCARLRVLSGVCNDVPAWDSERVQQVMEASCEEAAGLADLGADAMVAALQATLPAEVLAQLERWLPASITLPGGKRLQITYELEGPPWVESYLQDFFGMTQSPSVADGRVPITLHLWAPNRRPVQVTSDLAGFWARHYPELRRSLSRRYPRHDWPEDPARAKPPPPQRGGRKPREG